MDDATTFKLDEALAAQQAIRASLGMTKELFPVEAFVGMISDEIVASREAGHDDRTLVDLIQQTTGKTVTVEQIGRYYATPEERQANGR